MNPFSTVNQPNPFSTVNQMNPFSTVNQPNPFSTVNQMNPFSTVNQPNIFSTVNQMNPPTYTPSALDQEIKKQIHDILQKVPTLLRKQQNKILKKRFIQLTRYIRGIQLMKCKYIDQIFYFLLDVNTLLEDMEIFIDFDMFEHEFISQIDNIFEIHVPKLFPLIYKPIMY